MKKIAILMLICICLLTLSSCGESTEGFLDYQKSARRVDGVLVYGGCEYGVTMEFKKISEESDEIRLRRLEYTSPEEISGLVFERDGEKITGALLDIRIFGEYYDAEKIFFAEKLFSLKNEDIYKISAKKDGITVGQGKNEECLWEVTTGKDGLPQSIVYECPFGELELKIKKIYQ